MSKCSTNQENCGIQCIVQFEGDRLWMLCREKLLNAAVVQSKLERHVEAKHQCVVCWWGEITPKEALSHKKKKKSSWPTGLSKVSVQVWHFHCAHFMEMNKSMYVKNNLNQILCGFRGSCVKPEVWGSPVSYLPSKSYKNEEIWWCGVR